MLSALRLRPVCGGTGVPPSRSPPQGVRTCPSRQLIASSACARRFASAFCCALIATRRWRAARAPSRRSSNGRSGVAQSAEQDAVNVKVVGSSPTPGASPSALADVRRASCSRSLTACSPASCVEAHAAISRARVRIDGSPNARSTARRSGRGRTKRRGTRTAGTGPVEAGRVLVHVAHRGDADDGAARRERARERAVAGMADDDVASGHGPRVGDPVDEPRVLGHRQRTGWAVGGSRSQARAPVRRPGRAARREAACALSPGLWTARRARAAQSPGGSSTSLRRAAPT